MFSDKMIWQHEYAEVKGTIFALDSQMHHIIIVAELYFYRSILSPNYTPASQ